MKSVCAFPNCECPVACDDLELYPEIRENPARPDLRSMGTIADHPLTTAQRLEEKLKGMREE